GDGVAVGGPGLCGVEAGAGEWRVGGEGAAGLRREVVAEGGDAALCFVGGGSGGDGADRGGGLLAVDDGAALSAERGEVAVDVVGVEAGLWFEGPRSEEHTSELQSRENLVC